LPFHKTFLPAIVISAAPRPGVCRISNAAARRTLAQALSFWRFQALNAGGLPAGRECRKLQLCVGNCADSPNPVIFDGWQRYYSEQARERL